MFPKPMINYFPKLYHNDPKAQIFAAKIDEILDALLADIKKLKHIYDPVKCPENFLDVMGKFLQAGIFPGDTESEKRNKIAKAVRRHKNRGSFNLDAKPIIDAIAGGDSKLLSSLDIADYIMIVDLNEAGEYWATMGGDGSDDKLGIDMIGSGDELGLPGVVYIDVDNAVLTAEQIEKLRLEMLDIAPAYYKVSLGHTIGGGFTKYFTIG
jgi:phage tail-like protein